MEENKTNEIPVLAQNPNKPPAPPSSTILKDSDNAKPKGSKMSKLPWLIILVLLFLIGILGGYLAINFNKQNQLQNQTTTPTPTASENIAQNDNPTPTMSKTIEDPATANWKLYVNSDKGFSIKYPSDEFIRLGCPGEGLVLQTRSASNTNQDGKILETCGRDGRFTIEVQSSETIYNEPKSSKDFTVTKEEVKIGDDTANKFITKTTPECFGMCPEFGYEIRLSKNGKYYMFYLDNIKNEPTLEKMLNTFKFTQ